MLNLLHYFRKILLLNNHDGANIGINSISDQELGTGEHVGTVRMNHEWFVKKKRGAFVA